jgi:hypothetical protein
VSGGGAWIGGVDEEEGAIIAIEAGDGGGGDAIAEIFARVDAEAREGGELADERAPEVVEEIEELEERIWRGIEGRIEEARGRARWWRGRGRGGGAEGGGVGGDDGAPVGGVVEAQDEVAGVFEELLLLEVAAVDVGGVVVRAVDVDGDLGAGVGGVEEINAGVRGGDEDLRAVGESMTPVVEVVEEAALEVGVAGGEQGRAVISGVGGRRAGGVLDLSLRPGEQELREELAIDAAVIGLVEVREEAVVAGGLALLSLGGGAPEVFAGVWVEVAEREGLTRDPGHGAFVLEQAAEHARAALGGLVEEEAAAIVAGGQRLGGELAVFDLELALDGALEGGLQRRHDGAAEGLGGVDEEAVAGVFDVGDHALLLGGRGLVRLGVELFRVLLARPDPALGVEEEAGRIGVLAPAPAEVDPPDVGRVAVGEGGEGGAVLVDQGGGATATVAIDSGEVDVGAQVVADPQALFFVRGDPVAAAGDDVAHAEEVLVDVTGERVAGGATIRGEGARYGLDRAAGAAAEGSGAQTIRAALLSLGAEDDLVDLEARSFVVDDRAGSELGDGEEARAREELVVGAAAAASAGQVGREREAREVVAGEETFAGEVAVGVEVGVELSLGRGEQIELGVGLCEQAAGLFALLLGAGAIAVDGVLAASLLVGGAVEGLPAAAGAVEAARDAFDDGGEPCVAGGGVAGVEAGDRVAEGGAGALEGARLSARVGEGGLDAGLGVKRWVVADEVEEGREGGAEAEAGFGEPDRVDVRAEQVLVWRSRRGGVTSPATMRSGWVKKC